MLIAINKRTAFRLLVNHLPLAFCTRIILFSEADIVFVQHNKKIPQTEHDVADAPSITWVCTTQLIDITVTGTLLADVYANRFPCPLIGGILSLGHPGAFLFFGVAFKVKEAKEKPTSNPNA